MSKKEDVYKAVIKKYPDLGLPSSLKEFKKLFITNNIKFDKDTFLIDLANAILQELTSRLDFLLRRLYPSDIAVWNNERKFLIDKLGTEKLFKLFIDIRIVHLTMLNALDNIRLGNEDFLLEALNDSIKFFKDVLFKEFSEISKVVVKGWEDKFSEKKDLEHLTYIR